MGVMIRVGSAALAERCAGGGSSIGTNCEPLRQS